MLDKIYLEITNVCNMDCSFCHKTSRQKRIMTEEEFDFLTEKLRGRATYLYFHLMGEPTLHPLLPKFIKIAKSKGFRPILTTNGSLLGEKGEKLLEETPYKISISLHAPEANPKFADPTYLDNCIDFAKKSAQRGTIIALRLWNLGSDADNSEILDRLHRAFPDEWTQFRDGMSQKLAPKLFLEFGERFDWPDDALPDAPADTEVFCYALRTHVGILVDGSVVPCCLDSEGTLTLGNLHESEFAGIENPTLSVSEPHLK